MFKRLTHLQYLKFLIKVFIMSGDFCCLVIKFGSGNRNFHPTAIFQNTCSNIKYQQPFFKIHALI